MAGADGAGMDIAAFGAIVGGIATGGADDRAKAWREGIEDRIQQVDDLLVTADHHTIAALEAPDPA